MDVRNLSEAALNGVRSPQPANLFGQHGPRCPVCSGWGMVFTLNTDRATRYPGKCLCRGTGVDQEAVKAAEFSALSARIAELERQLGKRELRRALSSKTKLPPGKMSRQAWVELLAWATVDGTAIANSITETIVFPNVTIPANYLQDGRVLLLNAAGRLSTTGTPTIRFRLRWGGVAGTVIWDSGTITCGSTVTASLWNVHDVYIQTRSNGATGTVFPIGLAIIGSALAPTVGSATGAAAVGVFGSAGDDTPAAVTVDLTGDTALSLTALWSAQSASNTLTGHNYFIESKN